MHYTKKRAKILLFFDICKKCGMFFYKNVHFSAEFMQCVLVSRARIYLRCIVKCMFFLYFFAYIVAYIKKMYYLCAVLVLENIDM